MLKKIWNKIVLVYRIVYALFLMFFFIIVSVVIYGTMNDQNYLQNSTHINRVAMTIAILSLPGLFVQLLSLLTLNQKKKYILTTKCPKCQHKVDMHMVEE